MFAPAFGQYAQPNTREDLCFLFTYDFISDIVPHTRLPSRRSPFALLAHHPLQLGIARPALAGDPPIFHLGEVALKEVNLVLAVDARRVGSVAHHAEVVKHLALRVHSGVSSQAYHQNTPPPLWVCLTLLIPALVCGISSMRLMFCPFQYAVESSVKRAPCLEIESAAFL